MVQQHRMRQPQDRQTGQPAQEARREGRAGPLRRVDLQGEAVAEQERKQQVELGFEQHGHQHVDPLVQRPRERRIGQPGTVVDRGEHTDVDDQDAEQREAAQRVQMGQALRGGAVVHAQNTGDSTGCLGRTFSCRPLRARLPTYGASAAPARMSSVCLLR
ncbi:Uncharacterised protein [Bordetella pertussis]|nr:Uncharacterised protein [Bordetella pertussis]